MGSQIEDMRDASGLMYRRNRYYDPSTGRFTQEDPIGIAGGINLYGYAEGDPISNGDPLGLTACPYAGYERSTSLDDCPLGDDELFWSFAILKAYGGEKGAETIETVAETFQTIRFGSVQEVARACSADSYGCASPDNMTIHLVNSGPLDNALRLVHEAGTHVRMSPNDGGSTQVRRREEPVAWERVFGVYGSLPAALQTSTFYGSRYSAWKSDPGSWMTGLCRQIGTQC